MTLLLFVAGEGMRAQRAREDIKRVVDGDSHVEVVDVLADPGMAEAHGVLATPTLVRLHPQPERRVIGDLADRATVRRVLGLPEGSVWTEDLT